MMPQSIKKVLILGAGGHAQVVSDALLCAHQAGSPAVPVGYLDDKPGLHNQTRLGLPVFGSLACVNDVPHDAVILAIGDNRARQRLYETLRQHGEQFVTAIHPRATVATDVRIGPGSLICASAVINVGSHIGANVILNTACTVDHHNSIGDHVHIAPGAHLGGDVIVGAGALIGIGATVMPQRKIGGWSVVGAGAVVTTDIPTDSVVVGVPAKPVRRGKRTVARVTHWIRKTIRRRLVGDELADDLSSKPAQGQGLRKGGSGFCPDAMTLERSEQ